MQRTVVHQNREIRVLSTDLQQKTDELTLVNATMFEFPIEHMIVSQSHNKVYLFQKAECRIRYRRVTLRTVHLLQVTQLIKENQLLLIQFVQFPHEEESIVNVRWRIRLGQTSQRLTYSAVLPIPPCALQLQLILFLGPDRHMLAHVPGLFVSYFALLTASRLSLGFVETNVPRQRGHRNPILIDQLFACISSCF